MQVHGEVQLSGSSVTDDQALPIKEINPLTRKHYTHGNIAQERLDARSRFLKDELTLLDGEPGHGFTGTSAVTLAADAANKESGTQSLKITVSTAGGTGYAKKVGLNYDLSSYEHFRFWVKQSPVKVKSLRILFYSPDGSNYFASPYFSSELNRNIGDIMEISFSKADCTTSGAPNWNNCKEIWIEVAANATENPFVCIDNFKAQKSVVTKGKVIIRFDDGLASHYSAARPAMENAGIPGNCVVIPQRIVDAAVGSMTLDQLKRLQTIGWDISSHSWSHMDFSTKSGHQGYNDLKASQNWLIENGFIKGARSHVFPGHQMNPNTYLSAQQLFYINNSGITRYETLPWGNITNLNYVSGDLKTAAQLQAYVDSCATYRTLTIIMFHDIVVGGAAFTTDPTEFTNFINYLAGLNTVDVITYSDLIDGTWIATR